MKKFSKRMITLLIALAIGCTTGVISYLDVFSEADTMLTNWIYDHTFFLKADHRITIIALDEKSTAEYGNYTDWDKSLYAQAVSILSENDAAVIGLDFTLAEDPSGDSSGAAALANACKAAGNVVAAAGATYESPTEQRNDPSRKDETETPEEQPDNTALKNNITIPATSATDTETPSQPDDITIDLRGADASMKWEDRKINTLLFPYSGLLDYVSIGIVNASQQSEDGIVRNAALTVDYDGTTYDSFAVALYRIYQDAHNRLVVLPTADSEGLIGFHAIQDMSGCQVISFTDLLSGSYDTSLIKDNIVIIGEYKNDTAGDNAFSNFIHPNQNWQEITTQVSILQSLLNDNAVITVNELFQALFFATMAALFYLLAVNRKLWVTILSHIIILSTFISVGYALNYYGYRLSLLIPIIFFPCIIIMELIQRTLVSIYEKKRMEWTLKMYVDSQVVDAITSKSPVELASVSERRHIAVLFVDIRGFTTISESLEPEQVVEILNEYLSLVATAISHWGGTLDKFIGDAAMAIFNAPNDQPDYVLCAVCAAAEIAESSETLRQKFEKRFHRTVSFGIGVNCGDAIVGNIGCSSRMDYTAIGDTVNVAARLEANAKPGQILVSQAVMDIISPHVVSTLIGPLSLKGKTKTVTAYEINQITSLPERSSRSRKEHLLEKTILHSETR